MDANTDTYMNLLECSSIKYHEDIMSLDSDSIKSFGHIPDVQPILTVDEMFEAKFLYIHTKARYNTNLNCFAIYYNVPFNNANPIFNHVISCVCPLPLDV